ncbi:MAG TPA: FecR domain-containing protein [Chitinophagaceae bacterium]|nr:FecR domain-containing protein [Chitinophagaceae bacterium]
MTASRIEYLLDRFVTKDITPEEKEELMDLLRDPRYEATFKSIIQDVMEQTGIEKEMPGERADAVLANILQVGKDPVVYEEQRKVFSLSWMRVAAAAAFIVLIGGTYYWSGQNNRKEDSGSKAITVKNEPILPGTDKAVLTMSDGRTIVLENVENGLLAETGNTNIKKEGALLEYNAVIRGSEPAEVTFNTLSTPRGGQYRVVLSDGSKVWLNAASSLHFPTAFTGSSREVELTGEAYFEIAKNKRMPFHVVVNGTRINVLGTHFNVNAYSEEQAIKTSLLEGSVEVINGSFTNLIKPGEQAIVKRKNDIIDKAAVNMDAVMAWKNGLFEFEGADVSQIMRQIARWYDVEIEYAGKIPLRRFEGKISRNAQLSEVLQILELSNIKFSVVGKRIIVQ